MSSEKALQIIELYDWDKSNLHVHSLYEGLKVLSKHNMGTDYRAEHDIVYAADFNETVATMSEEEIIQMVKLGWHEEEEA